MAAAVSMTPSERHNAPKVIFGEGLFGTGMGFLSAMSVLPLLMERLDAGEVAIGLVGSIFWAGWLVLQPLGLFLFGGRRFTKRLLVPWSFVFSVPTYVAMACVVYYMAGSRPVLCAYLLLGLLAVRVLGGGMMIPFWLEWQSVIFRQGVRGRVIGLMAAMATLGAAGAAYAAGLIVEGWSYPLNYTMLFPISIVFFVAALVLLATVREPQVLKHPRIPLTSGELTARFRHSLSDLNFCRYLVGRILMTLGAGAAPFYAIHFQSAAGGSVPEATVIKLNALLLLGQCAVSYPLGRLGDKRGHKIGIVLGAAGQAGGILVVLLGRGAVACGAAFALVGMAWAAAWVSHVNILFETCPHDSRVAHITLSNMILGPALGLVPVGTGWLIARLGMHTGIALTLVPTVLGIVWLALMVKEPRDVELNGRSGEPDSPDEPAGDAEVEP